MRAWGLAIAVAASATACQSARAPEVEAELAFDVAPIFAQHGASAAAALPGCPFASPLAFDDARVSLVIAADSSGTVTAVDAQAGARVWQTRMPTPSGEDPLVLATPVLVGALLVVAYHTTPAPPGASAAPRPHDVTDARLRHRVVVLHAHDGKVAADFPVVELHAALPATGGGSVVFQPAHALARGALAHVPRPGRALGLVYLTCGIL